MTKIFNDNVQITLEIGGEPWHLKDAEVVLSRVDTPNYVDLLMLPTNETISTLPDRIDSLIGADFRLEADNDLISERDTNAEEDSLLFAGKLANISSTGENFYEGIAYDPAQQPFAEGSAAGGGSIMNEQIYLGQPEFEYTNPLGPNPGTNYKAQVIKASELVERAMEELGIPEDEYVIDLEENGSLIDNVLGSTTRGYDRVLWFSDTWITVKDALNKAREFCEAEWWFDKSGTFHFGPPDPTRHELKFITDADAGKTTPPYQSVRVIGSGSASAEGFSRTNMEIEDKIVVEASMAKNESGDIIANYGETKGSTFEYHNLEVSTDEQARSTAKKLIEELAEQQAEGTVTVVGFPEIVPMDGIIMPAGEGGDYEDDEDDIRNNQAMGGFGYNVYKVVHRLNPSDGFLTKIHVAGVTGVTKTVVSSRQAATDYDINEVTLAP